MNFEKKEDAQSYIAMIKQQVALMGANNYEFEELDKILKLLQAGDISEDEARSRVYAILESKQDYH